jgi:hypothetical protein
MGRSPRQPEKENKGAETEPIAEAESATPVGRFRLMTRRLLRVSQEEVAAAARRQSSCPDQKG